MPAAQGVVRFCATSRPLIREESLLISLIAGKLAWMPPLAFGGNDLALAGVGGRRESYDSKANIMAIGFCQNEPNFWPRGVQVHWAKTRRARWIEKPHCCRPDFSLNLHESANSLTKQNSQQEQH
jgi:hypothetical protein